ncbi:hypothetical protein UFOVP314_40 [uncultured Caudovirales phage]|uniref:Uncharacterized protein n=1 Tax=uncultured Caudovirales phage TaxID=2100421 RepID=A0A6J5LRG1_9CAUD|nr:hypothetical protein UFOVP314_40 [uncultured Caudovirales phage]
MRTSTIAPVLLRHPYPRASSSAAHYLGFGKQSAQGTGVAPTVFVPYQGAVDLSSGLAGDPIRQAGTGPYVNRTMKTAQDPSGSAGMAVRPRTFAQLIAWFLGADASASAGSLFDHTATPAETVTWLTTEQAAGVSGDIIERYIDTMLSKCTIACQGNGDLMATFDWTALSPNWQATAATATYETGVSGSTPGGPYRAMEATYTIDGAAASNVESWSWELEWKVDDIRLSRVTRASLMKLELTGKVKVKQLIDSNTARDDYRKVVYASTTGTTANKNFFQAGSFRAVFDNGLATTNQRTVDLNAPEIDWTGDPKYTALNPDGQTMYLEREGVIKKGTGAFVTVISRTSDSAAY